MSEFFRKTDAGRRELRDRRLGLPRPGRNLLLIIDGTRPAQEWVAMIQGASLTDVAALLDLGLIEVGTGSAPGDSQFAGMLPTGTPTPRELTTTPAGWTQLGELTRPDGLPSPGATPRHRALFESQFDAQVGTRPLPLPSATARRQPVPVQAAAPGPPLAGPARGMAPGGLRPTTPGPVSASPAPDSTLENSHGFVPLDPAPGGATGLGYAELYDSLNALVRETLGLLKGYRYSLKIERASGQAELEGVALEFVQEVRRLRGDSMARMVARALGLVG